MSKKWQPKFADFFIQFVLASLFIWGLGGIVYLTIVEMMFNGIDNKYTDTPPGLSPLVLPSISAFMNALLAVTIVHQFHRQLNRKWINYTLITGLCLGGSLLVNNVVFAWIPALLTDQPPGRFRFKLLDLPYSVNVALVGVGFFYTLTRERSRTRKITEQEYQLLHLKQRQTQAELEALQARINPHFLYNSLNSIASLIHEDPNRAEQMVLLLARFFRYSTNAHEGQFDSIRQELESVKTYLEVEKVRFDERLQYHIDCSDPALQQQSIPRFLLQPLVENAIKHGIARNTQIGVIQITICQDATVLRIAVHDNGPAFPEHIQMGYGLKSIEEKLRLLYGPEAVLEIHHTPRKQVVITLPVNYTTAAPVA